MSGLMDKITDYSCISGGAIKYDIYKGSATAQGETRIWATSAHPDFLSRHPQD